ncbi:hypothetical protein Taro_044929 [Colocasia esculenta]|uniref:Uncharacterized protein n=1 Tax=Colocasia esculenta TaxID=4460 RepID=A0A843WZ84_COLES|nr:hypothetical protein [Colocasia esculenta]
MLSGRCSRTSGLCELVREVRRIHVRKDYYVVVLSLRNVHSVPLVCQPSDRWHCRGSSGESLPNGVAGANVTGREGGSGEQRWRVGVALGGVRLGPVSWLGRSQGGAQLERGTRGVLRGVGGLARGRATGRQSCWTRAREKGHWALATGRRMCAGRLDVGTSGPRQQWECVGIFHGRG